MPLLKLATLASLAALNNALFWMPPMRTYDLYYDEYLTRSGDVEVRRLASLCARALCASLTRRVHVRSRRHLRAGPCRPMHTSSRYECPTSSPPA